MSRRRDEGDRRPPVVRRGRDDRREVPPEIEDLASGRTDRLPPRKRRPRLSDPRAAGLVPGVANRDARQAYEARTAELETALGLRGEDADADERLARGLAEAVLLGVWRGRSVTSFEAYAQDILGLDPGEARSLAERGAGALGVALERLSDEGVASWLRTEVALADAGTGGRVRVRPGPEGEILELELDAGRAPEALDAIGHRMQPLARDRRRPQSR